MTRQVECGLSLCIHLLFGGRDKCTGDVSLVYTGILLSIFTFMTCLIIVDVSEDSSCGVLLSKIPTIHFYEVVPRVCVSPQT
jgi:hypothetical protein